MESLRITGFVLLLVGSMAMNADAGTIKGVVKFAGDKIPPPKMLNINKDPEVCGKEKIPSDALLISKLNKGVKNALVTIKGIKTDKKPPTPKGKLKFVQKNCKFSPRILIVPTNTEFEIYNNDPLTHNIHTFGRENATINRGQPKTVPMIKHTFEVPERVKVKCDIHKWMSGWFIVVDNPYTVLSNDAGSFTISDVPAGTHTVQVWHEGLMSETKEVTVSGDEEVMVSFNLKAKKSRRKR